MVKVKLKFIVVLCFAFCLGLFSINSTVFGEKPMRQRRELKK